MSKQINIIWILSLISVLLLIGIQGYWLINQYEYTLNNYSEEVVSIVSQAGEEEYLLRKNIWSSHTSHYIMRTNVEDTITNKSIKLYLDIGADSLSIVNQVKQISIQEHNKELFQYIPEFLPRDTSQITLTYETNLRGEALKHAVDKAITNKTNPFEQARFDSILVSQLSPLNYTTELLYTSDSVALWKKTGSLLNPRLAVNYIFSPLDCLGVCVHITLPVQPVFYRMGIQLIVSVILTCLLIVSLVFQMRTILKQKKVNEIREDFVNTMVHELKRPVQTLKTFVSFLKDKKMRSDEETTELVERDAMFELDNLSTYLHKLKDMLQADAEKTALQITRFDLHELIEKVIRLTHIPPDKEVIITSSYETDDLFLEADPVHLANVLSNLIENAIKYSGDKVNIELQAGLNKRKVWVSVKDTGIGIPVAEQDKVFTKFYRCNNIPDKSVPGIGLGLSYVKLIIEAHQGSIRLDSQPGEGTAITIYLPL